MQLANIRSKRLIFGLAVLVIAVVALIYDFQKSNESTSLTLDNVMLQQYVDTKIKQIDGLIDGQATISEPVPAISQTPSSYLNTPVPPRSIFTVIGSYLNTPVPPTRIPLGIELEQQLPVDVLEGFEDAFYSTCTTPNKEQLRIVKSWSNSDGKKIEYQKPQGSYFLALEVEPTDNTWEFDSHIVHSLQKYQSLHVDSSAPKKKTNAQKWCGVSGYDLLSSISTLNITSDFNVKWTVYLIAEGGETELSDSISGILDGYYGACPSHLPISNLSVIKSEVGTGNKSITFTGYPPFNYFGVKFKLSEKDGYFHSVISEGEWSTLGPMITDKAEERIDFSGFCPSYSKTYRFEIQSEGGEWEVYIISTSAKHR